MATAGRTENSRLRESPVEDLLRREPYRFEFFQAMRLLKRLQPGRAPVGRFTPPSTEAVRIGANPSMAFPASQIQALEWEGSGQPSMIVNFMGLTGPLGVLPLYYTELLLERKRAGDTALLAFLDIFNHRIMSLFYQAWEKYRFYVTYERGERDRFSRYLLDLIGLGSKGLQNRQAVLDDSLIYYSGLLALQPRSAAGLKQLIGDYFDVSVEVEQFAGGWYRLDRPTQTRFQDRRTHSEQLGVGAVVGDEVWDPQSAVRLRLGPLPLARYLEFLPNGSAYDALRALTRFYSNDGLDFEIQLVLERTEVPQCELGAGDESAPLLGWVTWAASAPMEHDPDETILKM